MVKQKPTKKQGLVFVGIGVGVIVGGILLLVVGYDSIVGLPDSSSVEYKLLFGIMFMIIIGVFGLLIWIFEKRWNVKLT